MSKATGNTAKTTRVVQTPGTDPALNQEGATTGAASDGSQGATGDAFTASGAVTGDDAGTKAPDEALPPASDTAALQQQVAELAAMVKVLSAQRAPSSMPTSAKLPSMSEVLKNKPEVPVLTEEGWFVPATTLATRA
ncbi:hypothetical protein DBR37_01645 [Herminiimonas sp. KBW02]|uniref:hypothetical protein n=1 Tax=Herminiimonas sp. KBW02 TaxID=2153363 RepID=UPI000F5A72AB|nr:hypothetical protein [Herminiimonas sp. KBW02]RQO38624.1 hypothetical protein DBR37_01645 [Herminiimonas sp. KBW02]